jgi:transglutaminase-like putative cysteine protease
MTVAAGPGIARDQTVSILAEAALVVVSLVAVFSLGRLFDDSSYLAPLVTTVLVAHGTAIVLRRTRLGALSVLVIAIVSGAVVLTWLRYHDTTFLGLPSRATLAAARQDLSDAWQSFGEVVAPAPALPGFVLAAAIALWVSAWVADWAAFRLGSAIEAVLPPATVFVFVSLLGDPGGRTTTTVAFTGAALAFVLLHRVAEQVATSTWVGDGRRQGPPAIVAVGLAMIALAVAFGGIAGPRTPGADAAPMVDWHGRGAGDGTRVTVSPLVDIRKRLVDQSNTEAFSVTASRPSYWRLTALDAFDGSVWSSSGRFGEASGDLPGDDDAPASTLITQDIKVSGLKAIWLPAAFRPVDVKTDGTDVRYDTQSSTLIVDTNSDSSDGISYRVTSSVPSFDLETLNRNDGADAPVSIRNRYLPLPSDFPENVHRRASEIMAGGDNPYERARLLQDWFRRNFRYDLSGTRSGHSDQAIEDFLASRRGYCEQFAGTFAAMARSVGLPARVAVGFTPGEQDQQDADGNRYIVRGRNAHAWPEVYINQAGWVPFEPTPGRGAPGAQAWTGVPPQQDEADVTPGTGTTTTEAAIPTSTAPPDTSQRRPGEVDAVGSGSQGSGGGSLSLVARVGIGLGLAVLAFAAYVGLLAGATALRTRLRRRRATSEAARVRVAWLEGAEAVGRVAPPLRPAETHSEFAARVRPVIGPASRPFSRLAGLATATEWSGRSVGTDVATDAQDLSREVDREVRESLEPRQRLLALIDPRRLLRTPS